MKGVTQAVYDDWRARRGLKKQSVINIDRTELEAIYRAGYWAMTRGDDLPSGIDYAVFDFAVNSGAGRAARFLQACVDVPQDGSIGPKTLAAVEHATGVIDELCDRRQSFLESLPTFPTFGRGWTARVKRVRDRAKEMV